MAARRYIIVGRLAPEEFVHHDDLGKFLGAGTERRRITMCTGCGAIVADEEAHDGFHAKMDGDE